MLNFNTHAGLRERYPSHGQVFKAYPKPNGKKASLVAKVVALVLCCFSFQSVSAQQCNIATPNGTAVNLYLGANGITTLNSNVFAPYVSSPNCPMGTIELWYDLNATVPFPSMTYDCTDEGLSVPVFVTLEGPFSQSNAVLFTVTIVDNIPPIVAWPANVTVNADPTACAAVVNSLTPVVTDNCPLSYSLTWMRSATTPGSGSNGANGTYNVGTTNVTWTLVDANGTPNQVHTTTVTVVDNQPPIFTSALPGNVTYSANASCQATHNWTHPSVTDNCGAMSPVQMTYTVTFTGATTGGPFTLPFTGGPESLVFNLGVTTVTYRIDDDGAGPHAPVTHAFTVTVNDATPPVFAPAATVVNVGTVSCVAPVTLVRSASDNCDPSVGISFTVVPQGPNPPTPPFTSGNTGNASGNYPVGVYVITFTAVDNQPYNNTATHTVTLTVTDNSAPVVTCPNSPNDIFPAYVNANGTATVVASSLAMTSSDNCAVTTYELSKDGGVNWFPSISFNCGNIGLNNVKYRVKDAGGNISNVCDIRINVIDNVLPTAQCQSITANLDGAGNVSVAPAQVNNALNPSYDNCGIQSLSFSAPFIACATVNENNAFVWNTPPPPGYVFSNVLFASYGTPTGNCANGFAIGACHQYNSSSIVAGFLSTNTPFTANNATFGDPCGGSNKQLYVQAKYVLPSSVSYSCSNLGANTVTLYVTDVNGNTNNCSATITVKDVTPPTAICQNPPALVLNASGQATLLASAVNNGSTDNCPSSLTYSVSPSSFNCTNIGNNTVTLTVKDGGNNTSTCTATVVVQDNTPPTLVCPSTPINLYLDASGNATILASTVGAASTDNCTISLYEIRKVAINPAGFGPWATSQTYSCDDVGLQTVRLRAQDSSGNPNPIGTGTLCTNAINVVDNIAPVAICNSVSVALGSNGQVTIPASSVSLGSTDNCYSLLFPSCGLTREISKDGGVTYAPQQLFTCSNLGSNNLVHVRITDCHGNDAVCTTNVTIQDNELPVVTAPADITVQCSASLDPTINNALGTATATDNCTAGTPTYTDVISNGSCAQGKTVTRTWKSTDQSGNMGTDVQIITVIDNVAPTFTAPTDKVLDCPGSYTVANQVTTTFNASVSLPLTISPINTGIYDAPLNINVANNGRIVDLNIVDLVVEHDWMGDIDVILISPTGVPVVLVDDFGPCSNVNNLDIDYDDEASGLVPCNQLNLGLSSTPLSSLSAFDGLNMNGTWTLRIIDNTPGDGGALVGWGLEITYINQPNDLSLTGNVVGTDNCDPNPSETFVDFHGYKDFISHNEGGGYDFSYLTDWTSFPGSGTITPSATTVNLVGANAGAGNVNYIYNTPGLLDAGFIVFDWAYTGATPASDPFVVEINGVETIIKNSAGPNSGRAILPVPGGASSLVFRQKFGGNSSTGATLISNFLYYTDDLPVAIDGCERKFCIARVWNVADACGNAPAKQVQIIETRDITAPTVSYPTTKSVLAQGGFCSPFVDLDLSGFITDACSDYEDLTITNNALAQYGNGNGTDDASGFYAPGVYNITFTVYDECGNVKNHTITMTVTDSQNPTAICQNATVQLDNSGNATIIPASINNGSYDNCGVSSMTVTPNTFTTDDIGVNTVTLTVTDPAGNTNSCSGIVTVLGGVMFDAGDASGATGTSVLVPVVVSNFSNIISLDLDLDIVSGSVATVNTVEGIHPSLAGMLFPISGNTHVDVSWIGPSTTLPDGTVAFYVRVNLVGTSGASTPLVVNVVEVGTPGGVTPALGLSGIISIIDPGTQFAISGTLTQHANSGNGAVHLATVDYFGSVNGSIPNAPGVFSFNVPSGSNITIEPSKDINWNNGVSTLDALCTHYYSIGLPLPGACTGPVTPYQKIAADANANDAVTAFDAALIQGIAINNTPVAGNESWRFVPTVPALPSDPFALGFDEFISYTNVSANISNANFYGIKTGDVTAPFANGVTNFTGGGNEDRSADLALRASDVAVAAGQDVVVTFKANDFNGIFSMQTTLNFDPSVLEFVSANGEGLSAILFNTSLVAEGKLATSWYNLDAVTMEDGADLFTLRFKAKGNGLLSNLISTSGEMVMPEVATVQGDVVGVGVVFETASAVGDHATGHFALYQNRPNPFSTRTSIGFDLPVADHATLTITDAAGKTLKVLQGNFTAGYHQFIIERKDLPATGVVFYQLKTADNQAVKKMILVD